MLALRLTIVKTRDRVRGSDTEQPLADDVEQSARQCGELGDRQHVEIQRVQRHVDDDHRHGAETERQRHVPSWIAHFLCHVNGSVPSRIREHDRHEREQHAGHRHRRSGRARRRCCRTRS